MQRLDFGVESLDEDGESWCSVHEIFLAAKRKKQAQKQHVIFSCHIKLQTALWILNLSCYNPGNKEHQTTRSVCVCVCMHGHVYVDAYMHACVDQRTTFGAISADTVYLFCDRDSHWLVV